MTTAAIVIIIRRPPSLNEPEGSETQEGPMPIAEAIKVLQKYQANE